MYRQGNAETTLQRLSTTDEDYEDVKDQFVQKWLHDSPVPRITAIYRIRLPRVHTREYTLYREYVEMKGQFTSRGLTKGNERRRFHGTRRNCTVGDHGSTTLCASKRCSLCCIMKYGFDLDKAGKTTGFLRFGYGIYTSATSSKSDSYSKNLVDSSRKALLLNKVVVGKGKKLYFGDSTLTSPPPGYDSVIGEPAKPVGELNYDELVVYDEEAIIPQFLIIYIP